MTPGARLACMLWLSWALGCGCTSNESSVRDPLAALRVELPRAAPTRAKASETFGVGRAQGCRVRKLGLHLSEREAEHSGGVPADALVLRLQVGCEDGLAHLKAARAVWAAPGSPRGLRPSERTRTPPPEDAEVLQYVFEVPKQTRLTPAGPFGELRLRSPAGDLDLQLDTSVPTPGVEAVRQAPSHNPCARRTAALRERLAERFAQATRESPECNVLGWLAPLHCRDVHDTDLLEAALAQQRACDAPLVRALSRGDATPPPDDFRIALRRDRCPGSLDRCPRYTLAVYANGVTVFHGDHLVNALGRSDGRSHARLIAGLWRHVQQVGLLSRPGGWGKRPAECDARGSDEGALLTVQAGGRSRTLVDRDGCRAPFSAEEVDAVAARIDAVAGVRAWTDPPPAYADRHVRIWEVPAEGR